MDDDTRDPLVPAGSDGTGDVPADGADAAVARLRAADPAAGAEPDLARLQARLAQTTGVPVAADELAARRARRRPAPWLQVAAVAVGVALAGTGGYAVGAQAQQPAAPPIALQPAGGDAPAAGEMAAADGRVMSLPGWGGTRTVFTGSGLPGGPGTAGAWALDATEAATAQTAARAAEVLGVAGEPRQEWGSWLVGAHDGSSPSLSIGIDGQAYLSFYDPALDPWACTSVTPHAEGDGTGSDTEGADPAVSTGQAEPAGPDGAGSPDPAVCGAEPLDDRAATDAARDLLARLGVDTAALELTVQDDYGVAGMVGVWGAQVVDGSQTGLVWSVQLVGDRVQGVSGPLASLVELGEYDVISADEAVERLNDPRFGASYSGAVAFAGAREATADAAVDEMAVSPVPEASLPAVPSAGARLPWPVRSVTLTGARLGVTMLATADGGTVLVPAWELSAGEETWSVVAVVDDRLDLDAG